MVRLLHTAVKGRARFNVDGLHRSNILKREIEASLSVHPGVSKFSVNVLTGNVLVFFNSYHTPKSIASYIAKTVASYKKTLESWGSGLAISRSTSANSDDGLIEVRSSAHSNAVGREEGSLFTKIRRMGESFIHAESHKVRQWYLMEDEDVLNSFGTSRSSGMSEDLVEIQLREYGPNILPQSVPRSRLSIFIEQFESLPVALVSIAAGISILTGGVAEALLIAGVVMVNAAIGYKTETETERTIHSLKSLVKPSAMVLRDGMVKEIKAEYVLPGDILVLTPGSQVASDARLIETKNLTVDESALTGESMPVEKTALPILEVDLPIADRKNMVYMGTLVTGGQGLAVVVATGRFTEIGKIQILIGETTTPDTPIERQLDKLGTQLSFLCLAVCGGVFVIGLLRGYSTVQMLKISILLAVAAIPEGLPAVAASTLALGINRMKKLNILIRHLDAVETLGSIQTICLDKTGTLTMNRMSTVAVHTGLDRYQISDGKFMGSSGPVNPYSCEELLKLIHVSVLCNESDITMQEGEYILNGSPTENALLHTAISAGVDVLNLKTSCPLQKMHLRSEEHNYMSSLHRSPKEGGIIAVKGNPTEVLSMCSSFMKKGEMIPLTDDDRKNFEAENDRMAGDALRILGMAYYPGDDAEMHFETGHLENLIWLGLVGMADPIRAGVGELIDRFHTAGIDTIMITGDQSPTAYAIGKELNLGRGEQLEILESSQLDRIDPQVMTALCDRVNVFARVSPAHKLRIVQALQASGKTVAMTGDGINDGPALKAADIGIAMGRAGTDVAREVADVVLEDDNIETMIVAVSEGRTIYNNIRKSVHYLVSISLSEIMITTTAIAGGIGHPLNAAQLLYINLMSDIAPAVSLSLELPEPDVLSHPPREAGVPIIKSADFKRIGTECAFIAGGVLGAYGYGISRYGIGPHAGTLAFNSLVSAHNLHAISCRSEEHSMFDSEKLPANRYLTTSICATTAVQILINLMPGTRAFFGLTSIGLLDTAVIAGGATLPFLINERRKKRGNKK